MAWMREETERRRVRGERRENGGRKLNDFFSLVLREGQSEDGGGREM